MGGWVGRLVGFSEVEFSVIICHKPLNDQLSLKKPQEVVFLPRSGRGKKGGGRETERQQRDRERAEIEVKTEIEIYLLVSGLSSYRTTICNFQIPLFFQN